LRWLRKNRVDLATAASILLSVLVGLVGNLVVGSWSWASLAMLVVLAISLAGLEVLRHRLGKHETPQRRDNASGSSSTGAVAIENQHGITGDWVVAGGDVYQIHRETRIGSGAVLLIALVAAGAILATGRAATEADRPTAATPSPPLGSTGASSTDSPSAYSRSTLILSSEDFDPPKATKSLADASYNDDSGLSMLNSSSVAPAPAGKLLSAATCRALPADAWTSSIAMAVLNPGLQLCLHTSDDRWGTLAITRVESNALGGFLEVTWTVWT
jgi:hypothetical protein